MAAPHLNPLAYAVRLPVVAKYLSQLGLMVAILTALPLLVALLTGEYAAGLRYAAIIAGLLVLAATLGRLPASPHLQANEALVITALAFTLTPLLMSLPFMGSGLRFEDAVFETISAITTTGLSTLGSVEHRPAHLLFARAWMQWYGGLGIVVLGLALIIGRGELARRLAEGTGEGEDMVSSTRSHARSVLAVYGLLTAAGFAILLLMGIAPIPALLHTLSGVSTGGFSSYDNSLVGLGPWPARLATMLVALTGAVPLALYYKAWRQGASRLLGDVEVRGLVWACIMVGLILSGCMLGIEGMDWRQALEQAWLLGLSAQSGTGFSSMNVGDLRPATKLVLMTSMLIGGGIGSTAGGIKILRLLVLLRMLQLMVVRSSLPYHAVVEPHLGRRRLEDAEIERALLVLPLFLITIIASWLAFLVMGYRPLDSLFDVVSAVATVGLSTGITAPDLPAALKYVLCFDMLLGRLELVAFLVLLYPGTWFGKRTD